MRDGNVKYIGSDPDLIGHTAMGRWQGGNFFVQVDDITHPMSHWWWDQNSDDWELI